MKMRYSIVPSRAVGDRRITFGAFRTLAAMCCFTTVNGLCYPNQVVIASVRGVTQPVIAKHLRQLRKYGYVIDLHPIGKKKPNSYQCGNRYFIPIHDGDSPPDKEVIKHDYLTINRRPPNVYT